ncbi:uncharacterized protein M421DRAFT_55167 [Didymella exigua CBS 183.55]|uniref:Transcription factor domain-containing protein n=1 Tax=Didymella exigua CBS 183.55 TaxID=1150837 RepID=A0A6A5RYA3_9PLEO|nr:uncharacterized protein M421DRAFT_55167 [Didymella exigua CBS 183.55]KAF1932194.1 hypothetical protein M421DRAFT_55167 [Didymella exigua CBS 183.55]
MEGQDHNAKAVKRSQPTVPIQQDFLFVDASEAKASRQGRRNARSFVMQKARRARPWSTSKQAAKQRAQGSASPPSVGTPNSLSTPNTASSSPTSESSRNGYFPAFEQTSSGMFERGVCSNCQIFVARHGQTLCPKCVLLLPTGSVKEPNNSTLDPFGASALKLDREMSELLDHFVHEMVPGVIGVDVRRKSTLMKSEWFDIALSNKGFMHSLLSTAALHMFVFGKGTVKSILDHRAKAISAVNKALSTQDLAVRVSDATLGTVFNLLTVEEGLMMTHFKNEIPFNEQPNAMDMHLTGLREMLSLRGGLEAVGTNRILQAFILWHTTAHAIAHFNAPYPTTLTYIRAADLPHHPRGYSPNYSQHLVTLCCYAGLAKSLTELLESVLILAADLNAWYDDPESLLNALDVQNFSCSLECLLLAWIHEKEPLITPLEGALCVALIIFTVRTTEALKRPSDIHLLHFAASKRLESALNCTTRAEWQSCPDLLLWILSIGAISAECSAESAWFTHQSSLACAEFNIDSAEALLERLSTCGWVNYKLDDPVGRLWNRIVHLRLEPYLNVPSPNIGNADSPPGPLQNNLKETELTDWRTTDWAAIVAATPVQEAETSNAGVSWTVATATGSDDVFGDTLLHSRRDHGGYGLLCLYPVLLLRSLRLR